MKYEIETAVKTLAQKAENSQDKDEAMKYAQAALNLAHAVAMLGNNERAKDRINMPKGRGTYGNRRGRPKKKPKKK